MDWTRKIKLDKKGKPIKYVPLECDEQIEVATYLRKMKVLFTCSVAGVNLPISTAVKLQSMGYSVGTPDIFVEEPIGKYHGLRIEMKRVKGGVILEQQKKWIAALTARGYAAFICEGAVEAKKIIDEYFGGENGIKN